MKSLCSTKHSRVALIDFWLTGGNMLGGDEDRSFSFINNYFLSMNCNFEAFIGSISITPYCTCKTIAERMNERPADEKISRWFLLDCYCARTCSKSMGSRALNSVHVFAVILQWGWTQVYWMKYKASNKVLDTRCAHITLGNFVL